MQYWTFYWIDTNIKLALDFSASHISQGIWGAMWSYFTLEEYSSWELCQLFLFFKSVYLFLFFPRCLIKPYILLLSLHTHTDFHLYATGEIPCFSLRAGVLIFNAYLKYISTDGILSVLQGLTEDKSFSSSAEGKC